MISKTIKIVLIITIVTAGILAIIGYYFTNLTTEAPPVTEVSVQFKWVHAAQFAGFYVAKDKGIYQNKEIIPHFFENSPNLRIDPIESVVNKETQFAVAEGSAVIRAIASGEPIVAIGTNYQTSPVVVFALAESGIEQPKDLVGKTLKISPTTHSAYEIMMAKLGIDTTQIKEISKTSGATRGANYLEDIKDRTFDASEGYLINQPLWLRRQGYDVVVLPVSDYGVESYSDVIITHKELWQSNPELVQNFVLATRQGWIHAFAQPEQTVELIMLEYRPDSNIGTTATHERALLEASKVLVMPTTEDQILKMSETVWQNMVADLGLNLRPKDIYIDL